MKFTAFAVFSTGLVVAATAYSHEAPTGWKYPYSCCSGIDCRMVSSDWVRQTPTGYKLTPTSEVIPYSSTKIKPSPDGMYHWCTKLGKDDTPTICLFVPPGSS